MDKKWIIIGGAGLVAVILGYWVVGRRQAYAQGRLITRADVDRAIDQAESQPYLTRRPAQFGVTR